MIPFSTPAKPSGRDVRYGLPRSGPVACACGGYADRVACTEDERAKFNCGRWGCCSRAFVCRACGNRIVGMAEAPEMD